MSESYESLWKTRAEQHDLNHNTNIRNSMKDPSCTKCNPVKEEISERFQKFWRWYSKITPAITFTQRTIEGFREILKEDITKTDRRNQLVKMMMRIFESIRYSKSPEIKDATLRMMMIEILFCSQSFELNEEDTNKRLEELNKSPKTSKDNTPEKTTPEMNSPKEETSRKRQNDEMELDEPYQNEERSSRTITDTMNRRIEQETIFEQEDLRKYIENTEENNSEMNYERNSNIEEIDWKKNETPGDTDSERDERDSNEGNQTENREERIITERRKEKQPENFNSSDNNYLETYENRSFGWMNNETSYFGGMNTGGSSYYHETQNHLRGLFKNDEAYNNWMNNDNETNRRSINTEPQDLENNSTPTNSKPKIKISREQNYWNITPEKPTYNSRPVTPIPIVNIPKPIYTGQNQTNFKNTQNFQNKQQNRNQIMNNQVNNQNLQQILQNANHQNQVQIKQLIQQHQNFINGLNLGPAVPGMRNIVKYEKFYGNTEEDPTEWVEGMNRAMTANNVPNADKLAIAVAYLKGEAAEWYERDNANIAQWHTNGANNNLDERLIANFSTEAKRSKWYQEYEMLKQEWGESVDSYANRYRRILRRTDPNNQLPEAMKAQKFLRGLLSTYIPYVSGGNLTTLDNVINTAKQVEMGMQIGVSRFGNDLMMNNNTGINNNIGVSNKNQRNKSVSEEEVDKLTEMMKKLEIKVMDVTRENQNNRNNYTTQYRRNDNRTYNNNRNNGRYNNNSNNRRNNEEITCWTCKRTGHISTDCPDRNTNNRNGNNNRNERNERRINYLNV